MFNLFVLTLFIHLASAGVYIRTQCPHIKVVENFDMSAYGNGKWYEIARYPNEFEKQGDCSSTTVTPENDRYKFKSTEILDGRLVTAEGYYDHAPNVGNDGIINVHPLNLPAELATDSFPVHIVKVDYENYAISYECVYNEETQTRHDFAWIMSRSTKLSEESKNDIENYVKTTDYIDMDKFEWDHFTEESCTPTQ